MEVKGTILLFKPNFDRNFVCVFTAFCYPTVYRCSSSVIKDWFSFTIEGSTVSADYLLLVIRFYFFPFDEYVGAVYILAIQRTSVML